MLYPCFNGIALFLVQLYDLHIGEVGEHENTEDGCLREDVVCGANDVNGPHCGQNGTCIGSFVDKHECVCDPGWRGPKCSIRKWIQLSKGETRGGSGGGVVGVAIRQSWELFLIAM